MVSYTIGPNEAQQRFDKYLKKILKDAPDSFIYKMLRKKNIVLNNKKCDGKEKLSVGDEVKIFLADETFEKFSGIKLSEGQKTENISTEEFAKAYKAMDIPIVYEDEHILIANKPEGVLSQKSTNNDISINEWFVGYLLHKGIINSQTLQTFKPSICNRLDRNTTGMIICGKTLPGVQLMTKLIKDKDLDKYYLCIIYGSYNVDERIKGYLVKNTSTNTVKVYQSENDIPAKLKQQAEFIDTSFKTVKVNNDLSLIEVQIHTGKTHQIRAHLASVGYPLVGDRKYGNDSINHKFVNKGVKNQLLHSYKLVFPSIEDERFKNISNKTLCCDPPEIFNALLYSQGKKEK